MIASSNSPTEHLRKRERERQRNLTRKSKRKAKNINQPSTNLFKRIKLTSENPHRKEERIKKQEEKKKNEIEEEDRRPILGFEIPIYFKTSETPPPNREIWCRRRTLSILLLFKQTEIHEF